MGAYLEVELDDEPAGQTPAGRRPVAEWFARRWAASGTRGWAFLAAVLAVLMAATNVAAGTAAARWARPTGLTTDLTVPRAELWRADGAVLLGVVADVLVVSTSDGTGAAGLRLADGVEVWRAEDGGSCSFVDVSDPGGSVTVFGGLATGPGERRLVCTSGATEVTTVVREPVTGRELLRITTSDAEVATVGADLVLVDRGTPSTVRVWSLVTGELRWEREVEGAVNQVQVYGDVLAVRDDAGFDLATGEPVLDPAQGDGQTYFRVRLRGGAVAETRLDGESGDVVAVVSDAAGVELWRAEGFALPMPVDEPAGRGILPVVDPDANLAGYDLLTGERRWELDLVQGYPVLGAAGVLGVAMLDRDGSAAGLVVLDPGTGAELWRTDLASGGFWPMVPCDGSHMGLPEEVDGQWVLVVRDLRTGGLVATWPLADGGATSVLGLPDGRLVQVSETGVVLLG